MEDEEEVPGKDEIVILHYFNLRNSISRLLKWEWHLNNKDEDKLKNVGELGKRGNSGRISRPGLWMIWAQPTPENTYCNNRPTLRFHPSVSNGGWNRSWWFVSRVIISAPHLFVEMPLTDCSKHRLLVLSTLMELGRSFTSHRRQIFFKKSWLNCNTQSCW